MSYIRMGQELEWTDGPANLYVYSDGDRIQYLPTHHAGFVEIAMRMLDQSGELTEEELAAA